MRFLYIAGVTTLAVASVSATETLATKLANFNKDLEKAGAEAKSATAAASIDTCYGIYTKALKTYEDALLAATKEAQVDDRAFINTTAAYGAALKAIVAQDLAFMERLVTRPDGFDKAEAEKHIEIGANNTRDELKVLLKTCEEAGEKMHTAITKTQDKKILIEMKDADPNAKEETVKQKVEKKIRPLRKSAEQVQSFSKSLLRSDAMTIALSVGTTVLASVAVVSAFFL